MQILLTGYKGNLGSYINNESSDDIIGVGRAEWENIEKYFTDNIDTIIHSAYDLKSKLDELPEKYLKSNVITTAKLLELAKKYNVRRFVFISSCAVYGNAIDTQEDQVCAPTSTNGIVKLLNEKVIQDYCKKNNMKCEIYRVFNMYGGNDHFSIVNYIKKSILNDSVLRLNNKGLAQRDFIHVNDVAKIILALMKLEHKYECVNVGTGVSTKIIDIVDCVRKNHNNITVENNLTNEVEISKANIDRLHLLLDFDVIKIENYMSNI